MKKPSGSKMYTMLALMGVLLFSLVALSFQTKEGFKEGKKNMKKGMKKKNEKDQENE